MKRLNNKGITLIELIVSFAIVSVAMVYFYQTLYTVRKLYVTAQKETNEFIYKNYAIRIVDKYIDKSGYDHLSDICGKYFRCNGTGPVKVEDEDLDYGSGKLLTITIPGVNGDFSFKKYIK